jgi:hypothetical protein
MFHDQVKNQKTAIPLDPEMTEMVESADYSYYNMLEFIDENMEKNGRQKKGPK